MWVENFYKIFKWNIDKFFFFIYCMLLNVLFILSNFNVIVSMFIMSFYFFNDFGCCVINDNVMVNFCNSLGKRIRFFVEREKRWGFVFDNFVFVKWKNYFFLIMFVGVRCIYICIYVFRVNFFEFRYIELWWIFCIVLFKCCLGNILGIVLFFKWYRFIMIFVLLMEFMFLNRFNKFVIV